jgi:hypothetical protein
MLHAAGLVYEHAVLLEDGDLARLAGLRSNDVVPRDERLTSIKASEMVRAGV